MFAVRPYCYTEKDLWNRFVRNAKNGTVLFERDYMDYHSDRFADHSLMIFRKNVLYGLLPGNIREDVFYSHQGLTYGGLMLNSKATALEVLDVFELINVYLRELGISKVIYKPTPHIYHNQPCEEDLYAMFRLGAVLIGCNISSSIYRDARIKFIESRKGGIRKANAAGVEIVESDRLDLFWRILHDNLVAKYGVAPVHTLEEMELLRSRFPEKIRLFLAMKEGIPMGGTLVYDVCPNVVHTQYISASLQGKELGVLDLLFDKLINDTFANKPVFDFGQSTEEMGRVMNNSLIFQKEGFGGRGIVYNTYEYAL